MDVEGEASASGLPRAQLCEDRDRGLKILNLTLKQKRVSPFIYTSRRRCSRYGATHPHPASASA